MFWRIVAAQCVALVVNSFRIDTNGEPMSLSSSGITACVHRVHPKIDLEAYERWPFNSAGGCVVGGASGSVFYYHQPRGVVRSLTVWWTSNNHDENSGVKAIRLEYFNDLNPHVFGHPEDGPLHKSIRFQVGEKIAGDVTLSGNGWGSRLGFIKFSTSAGQDFQAGDDSRTKYLFPSGNSFISGIVGLRGSDINALAFIFWKPLEALQLLDISYPTLDTQSKITSPTVVASFDYCNDNGVSRSFGSSVRKVEEKTGSQSCFTDEFSNTVGVSLSVGGSIPLLGDASAETSWEVRAGQTIKNCDERVRTETVQVGSPAVTLEPHKRTKYQYTQWQGSLTKLPYNATLRMEFTDGATYETNVSGSYNGTLFMSIHQSWTNEETGVTSCT